MIEPRIGEASAINPGVSFLLASLKHFQALVLGDVRSSLAELERTFEQSCALEDFFLKKAIGTLLMEAHRTQGRMTEALEVELRLHTYLAEELFAEVNHL